MFILFFTLYLLYFQAKEVDTSDKKNNELDETLDPNVRIALLFTLEN